jgi:hypothetical protein
MWLGIISFLSGMGMFGLGLYAALHNKDAAGNWTKIGKTATAGIIAICICFLVTAIAVIYALKSWEMDWTIPHAFSVAFALIPLAYVIAVGVSSKGTAANQASRTTYLDTLKTMITASGVAIAVISAGLQPRFNVPVFILQRAVICLIISIVASVATMFLMSYFYDVAGANAVPLGHLGWVLTAGYFALAGFFLGFGYLARIPFYIQPPTNLH